MQVEGPSQQPDVIQSVDAIYSLVVSVKSSPPIHEVYIDAHFHYTALKVEYRQLSLADSKHLILALLNLQILKLRRHRRVHGKQYNQFSIKKFRYDSTASSNPFLNLILPEKNPYIVAVEPEDGMVVQYHCMQILK